MRYLLFLDRDDDISSLRKKLVDLHPGSNATVAIVVPPDNLAFASPDVRLPDSYRLPSQEGGGSFNFRLLKRYAAALSIQPVILAESRAMRLQAAGQELPCFSSLKSYRSALARQRMIRQHDLLARIADGYRYVTDTGSRVIGSAIKVGLLIFLLSLVLAGLYLLLPSATVTLAPVAENLDVTLNLQAKPSVHTPTLADTQDGVASIPAYVLQQTIESTRVISTTGLKYLPYTRSSGQVSFFNRTNQEVTIPRGTEVIASGGQHFQTVDEVRLPASPWSVGRVAIVAELPGSAGNVDELQINRVAGSLELQVVVVNEAKTSGGDERKLTVVSQDDKERLRAMVLDQLQREAADKLKNQPEFFLGTNSNSGLTIIQPSLQVDVSDEAYSGRVDQEQDSLALKMRVRASVMAFDYRDLSTIVDRFWSGRIKPGYTTVPGSERLATPQIVRVENDGVTMKVSLQGTIAATVDEDTIRAIVQGRPADEAERELASSLKLASEPSIHITPAWTDRALRVQVVVVPAK